MLGQYPGDPLYPQALDRLASIANDAAEGNIQSSFLGMKRRISMDRTVEMLSRVKDHAPRSRTSAVADAIVQDGTYRIADTDQADAILEGELQRIQYRAIRGTRQDSLFPEELANTVTLRWTLRDARDPTRVLATGVSEGTSQLFVSANLQTARNNALPEALDRAGEALVSRLADGY